MDAILFNVVFFTLVFGVPSLVAWATYNERLRLDLSELWTHQGRIDKFAVVMLVSWWVHTCSMILWTLAKDIQTQDWTTYQLWALPIIAALIKGRSEPADETKP